jgi:hypothetical protein
MTEEYEGISDEMREGALMFMEYVKPLYGEYAIQLESKLNLDWIDNRCGGTCDFIALDMKNKVCYVVDYKFGYAPVEAVDNWQLTMYALGAVGEKYSKWDFVLTIIQPNVNSSPITHTYTGEEMEHRVNNIGLAIIRIDNNPNSYQCGTWCKYCPGKAACPAKEKEKNELIAKHFNPAQPIEAQVVEKTPQQLEEIVSMRKSIEDFLQACQGALDAYGRSGGKLEKFKYVKGKKGNRKWANEEQVKEHQQLKGLDIYKDPELKTPTQLEKQLKQEGVDIKFLKVLVTQSEAPLKLVPKGDKGTEVVNVGSYFEKLEN